MSYIITGDIKSLPENYLANEFYYHNGGVVMAKWEPYGWEIKKVGEVSPFTTPQIIREFKPSVLAMWNLGDAMEQPFPLRRGIWLFHDGTVSISFLKRMRKLSYVRRIIELNLVVEKQDCKFVLIENEFAEPLLIGKFHPLNGVSHSAFPL